MYTDETSYLYVWDGIFGKILSQGYKFTTNEKHSFSFEYDKIYYEPETNLRLKIYQNSEKQLTNSEISEIQNFCYNFVLTEDYNVYAYNETDFVYEGYMLKSEAEKNNFKYRLTEVPDHPASKWNDTNKKWEKIKASILESGTLILDPASICVKCVIALTESEYAEWPTRPTENYIWDFVSQKWVDPRDINALKHSAQLEVRNLFEPVRWKVNGKYVPQFEQGTWATQYIEASSWLANNTNVTPYIDTFLSNISDEYKPLKIDLCNDIINNHNNFISETAKVNAKQWNYLKRIEAASENSVIDSIIDEVKLYIKTLSN